MPLACKTELIRLKACCFRNWLTILLRMSTGVMRDQGILLPRSGHLSCPHVRLAWCGRVSRILKASSQQL